MKILIKDDFLDNPNNIRQIGLSQNYRTNYDPSSGDGWRGERTLAFRPESFICPCCNQGIKYDSSIQRIINEESKKIFNFCDEHFNFESMGYPKKELTITTFFHISTEETINSLSNFWQDKFHIDPFGPVAGIVYLNPNAPLNAGTSILDGRNNKIINVENYYNRLVAYDSNIVHGISDVFGNDRITGRMTLTFFIHSISVSENVN